MRRICIVLALSLAALAASAADDAPVLWPRIKAGDRWTYRLTDWFTVKDTYELKVTFVGDNAVQAVSKLRKSGEEIDTSWTRDWNAVTDQRGGSFFPDSEWLRFPLKPGIEYTAEFEVARPFRDPVAEGANGMAPGGSNASYTAISYRAKVRLNVSVVGWEDVTVPAGTFHALKIDAPGPFEATDTYGNGDMHFVIWYVPEVRRWVKWSLESTNLRGRTGRRDTEELLEYHLE